MKGENRGIFLVLGVLVFSAVVGGIYGPSVRATSASADDMQSSIRSFTRVLSVVEQNYAEPLDTDRAMYQGAIPGMLRVLDPHSNFFDARQFSSILEEQHGLYYGVGMSVAPRENRTVVLSPYVGSPAHKAGIRPGDAIIKVKNKSTTRLSPPELTHTLNG